MNKEDVMKELIVLRENRLNLYKSVSRKRALRPSEKAMWLASINRTVEALDLVMGELRK